LIKTSSQDLNEYYYNNNNTTPFCIDNKSRKQNNEAVQPLKDKGQLISQSKEKAHNLLKQFSSVFTKEKTETMPNTPFNIKENIPSLIIRKQVNYLKHQFLQSFWAGQHTKSSTETVFRPHCTDPGNHL